MSHSFLASRARLHRGLVVAIALVLAGGLPAPAAAQTGGQWVQRFVDPKPSVGFGHALAFDVARDKVVCFGGMRPLVYGGQVFWLQSDETWIFNGSRWSSLATVNRPPARAGHVMAYDVARSRVVLFGGVAGQNDTWEFDGTDWTVMAPPIAPPAGLGALCFDTQRNVCVLVTGASQGAPSATWEWNGTTWTERFPTGPVPEAGGRLAFDAVRGKSVYLLVPSSICTEQTWEWDGQSWVGPFPGGLTHPIYDLTFHAGLGKVVASGGGYRFGPNCAALCNGPSSGSLWEWSGTGWQLFSNGAQTGGAAAVVPFVHDPNSNRLVGFYLGHTREFVLAPPARSGQGNHMSFSNWACDWPSPVVADAVLDVAGEDFAATQGPGPFPVALSSQMTARVALAGPPNAPFVLFAGPQNNNTVPYLCHGIPNIGTPPGYGDVIIVLNGLAEPLYQISPSGLTTFDVVLPPLPPGPIMNIQAAILQPVGSSCSAYITAAFYVTIV